TLSAPTSPPLPSATLFRSRAEPPQLVDLLEEDAPEEALTAAAEEATGRAGALSELVDLEAGLPERETTLAARRDTLATQQKSLRSEEHTSELQSRFDLV